MNSMKKALFGSNKKGRTDKSSVISATERRENFSGKGEGSVCETVVGGRDDAHSVVGRQDAEDVRSSSSVAPIIQPATQIKEETKRKKKSHTPNQSETTEVRNDDDLQSRVSKATKTKKKESDKNRNTKPGNEKIVVVPKPRQLPTDYYTSIIVTISPNSPRPSAGINRWRDLVACG